MIIYRNYNEKPLPNKERFLIYDMKALSCIRDSSGWMWLMLDEEFVIDIINSDSSETLHRALSK